MIGIVVPLFMYTEPRAELLSQSNLRINGLGTLVSKSKSNRMRLVDRRWPRVFIGVSLTSATPLHSNSFQGVDLQLKLHNPNRYPVAFQNLELEMYDYQGVHVGQVRAAGRYDRHHCIPHADHCIPHGLPPNHLSLCQSLGRQVNRKERMRVPARSSAVMSAKAELQASLIELLAMGVDCIANDNYTK